MIIVGGGAAGLSAAISAAQQGASVTIVEKNIRVGKKILATGNGRCNLSNTAIGKPEGMALYNHPEFVTPVLRRLDCASVRLFFYELGLLTVVDKNGWVFPRTQTANTVLDVLLNETDQLPISIFTGQEIIGIRIADEGFRVDTTGGGYLSKSLVLSCGVEPLLVAFDFLEAVKPEPILGPLRTNVDSVRGLDGIRAVCRVYLTEEEELVSWQDGELLFRDYGVSGIAIFNLSRYMRPGQSLFIDFFPDLDASKLESLLTLRWEKGNGLSASEILTGMLHSRIIQAVLRKSKIKAKDKLDQSGISTLAKNMKRYHLIISGGPSKEQAQVTRGGLSTKGFDPMTLMALDQRGLFAAGECLDVDGPCGGFNLHWAWASGIVAGENAASFASLGY